MKKQLLLLIIAFTLMVGSPAKAQLLNDSLSSNEKAFSPIDSNDENKNVDELIIEASELFQAGRSIDARTKLLRALKLAPNDFRPHMFLGSYYLSEVGHFRLAYRYITQAVDLFEKENGGDSFDLIEQPEKWNRHAQLLLLLSESQLNLDRYQDALSTLERFEKSYWDPGEPASKAWILMKLNRTTEAINVARWGLLRSAKKANTYNILGILLSLTGNKELALTAFGQAIKTEADLGNVGQISTPLNNSGEVYREWFEESLAKASFTQILNLPDGCDHILPSLNLAFLFIDEGRLIKAEQTLKNFETCFKQNVIRSDTEHRALLALGYGKIALRKGDASEALTLLKRASEETQWFGKIGTTAEDVQLAVAITTAQALTARAAEIRDTQTSSYFDKIAILSEAKLNDIKSWWLMRRAREIGITQLSDLEDLYIRHSDAMLEYPTFGDALAGFPLVSLQARLQRMVNSDPRTFAKAYYLLYLCSGLIESGDYSAAISILTQLDAGWRPVDRLVNAQTKRLLLLARIKSRGVLHSLSTEEEVGDITLVNSLFQLMPAMVRHADIALPIRSLEVSASNDAATIGREIAKGILRRRFTIPNEGARDSAKYFVKVAASSARGNSTTTQVTVGLQLVDATTGEPAVTLSKNVTQGNSAGGSATGSTLHPEDIVNQFISDVFKHRLDPAEEPLPTIPVLEGIFGKEDEKDRK